MKGGREEEEGYKEESKQGRGGPAAQSDGVPFQKMILEQPFPMGGTDW